MSRMLLPLAGFEVITYGRFWVITEEILKELVVSADWSISAAREILRLVEDYGAFMLRNALAIAVVLGKEDDAAGF